MSNDSYLLKAEKSNFAETQTFDAIMKTRINL